MPQIRGDQLKPLTLKDAQIANDAAIRQHKILDDGGWISQGIMHICTTLTQPNWNGDQNGLLYYLEDSQELRIGTNTDPFYTVIGKSGGRWNVKVTRIDGFDATDWDESYGTEFVSQVPMNQDGSNSLIYLNGVLHRLGELHDYTIMPNLTTIKFNYGISSTDVVTIVVYADEDISNYLDGYVTKAELAFPVAGNSGASLVGVGPIQNIISNNLQDVLSEIKYQLDESIKQYDHVTTSMMGTEALDYSGSSGTEFRSSVEFASDSSNLFVYHNGQLLKYGVEDDYDIISPSTIKTTFNVLASDRITMSVMTNLSMSSYATYAALGSTINGFSGANKIGVTIKSGIRSQNVQDVLADLALDMKAINDVITPSNNKVGFFGQLPEYAIDIRTSDKINSKSGYLTLGKCISQYFKKEGTIIVGDLVGVNISTGYVRKYINGDVFVGVCVEISGYSLNVNKEIQLDSTYCEVGIKGSMSFNQTQTLLINREVYTLDNKRIGVLLANGDLFM